MTDIKFVAIELLRSRETNSKRLLYCDRLCHMPVVLNVESIAAHQGINVNTSWRPTLTPLTFFVSFWPYIGLK